MVRVITLLCGLLLLFGGTLVFAQSGTDEMEPFLAEDVRVEGLQRLSSANIFRYIRVNVGQKVDAELIHDIIQSLFATGYFDDVQIYRDGHFLVIKVQERPLIAHMSIKGSKAIKEEDLLKGLKDAGLSEGEVFKRATMEGIRSELQRQYTSQGRYDSKIVAQVKKLSRNRVSIRINVDEGSPSRIDHINIIGNKEYGVDTLLGLFELRPRKILFFFSRKRKYSRDQLQADLDTLESWYLDRGFLRFNIDAVQVSLSPDYKSVYITISINEGKRYTVGKANLVGDIVLDEKMLLPIVRAQEGQIFSQLILTQIEEGLTNLLNNSGYNYAEVNTLTEVNDDDFMVDLNFFINPGKRMYVRRIEFVGNDGTNDEVLRRELRQMESAPASLIKIDRSKLRLERLGFFKSVDVETQLVPGETDQLDVNYVIEEQPSGSIGATIGYSQSIGLLFGFNIQQANFRGTGRTLQLNLDRSQFQQNYNINLLNPYYSQIGISRGISFFYRELDFDELNITSYATNQLGGGINFGYPINETSRISFGVSLTNTDIETGAFAVREIAGVNESAAFLSHAFVPRYSFSMPVVDVSPDMPALDVRDPNQVTLERNTGFIEQHGNSFNMSTINLAWTQSRLNRGQLATRGYSQNVGVQIALPTGGLQFYKLNYTGQYFWPIMGSEFTLRLHTRLGYGDGYSGNTSLPFFENYFLGGINSIRGFRANTLGSRSTPAIRYVPRTAVIGYTTSGTQLTTLSSAEQYYEALPGGPPYRLRTQSLTGVQPFGGNFLVQGNIELLIPLPFLDDRRSVRAALFFDFGNVFDTACATYRTHCIPPSSDALRYSYGMSWTWLTALGALTFSYAFPQNTDQFDITEQFQFSIGSGFN